MVLRKPYAFIIKHFRLIHLIMLGCLLFLLVSLNDIHSVFKSMQSTSTYMYAGAEVYINNFNYYVILVVLALTGVVYWLLKEKKKPTVLYLAMLVYLVIVFLGFSFLFSIMRTMMNEIIESDQIILGKDIAMLCALPSYVFIAICFTRGIGFNIKQFNFSKDIEELQIADKDSAEFEVLIGQNNYKYMRFFRRTIREIKYYILENKFVISGICGILVVGLSGVGIYYYNAYLKKMSESEATSVNNITYTVRRSYITERDFNGNEINDKYKYVVVDMSFYNSSMLEKTLDMTKITLTNGALYYYPTLTKNGKFYDLGVPYGENQVIPSGETIDATLTFEIPSTTTSSNFTLRVQYALENQTDRVIARYRKFAVDALKIDADSIDYNKNINETMNVNTVGRNKFDLTITNYKLLDTYDDKYVTCKNINTCTPLSYVITPDNGSNLNTILMVEYDGDMYDDANFTKTFNSYNKVFENYCTVKYTIYNREYMTKTSIVSKSDVDNKVFINIERRITEADSISLVFNFRDEVYEVPLLVYE